MSTQVSVPVGSSATLIASGFSGLVINTDSKNAVWLSSSPSVQAGQGVPLQPLGSANWNQGGPIYGVVAAGVTSPVTLNLSTESTNVDNPVAVGSAVAAQLLSQGVPSVLTGAMINGVGNNMPFDVGGYASVSGTIDVPAAGYVVLQWFDPTYSVLIYEKFYTFGGKYTGWQFSTPVYGPKMNIVYNGSGGAGAALNITLYGSNRQIEPHCVSQYSVNSSRNQAFAGNATYALGNPVSTNGGLASFNIRCTPAVQTAKGNFGYQYWDLNTGLPGSLLTMTIADTTQMHVDDSGTNYSVFVQSVVPAGVIQPVYFCEAANTGIVVFTGIVN